MAPSYEMITLAEQSPRVRPIELASVSADEISRPSEKGTRLGCAVLPDVKSSRHVSSYLRHVVAAASSLQCNSIYSAGKGE